MKTKQVAGIPVRAVLVIKDAHSAEIKGVFARCDYMLLLEYFAEAKQVSIILDDNSTAYMRAKQHPLLTGATFSFDDSNRKLASFSLSFCELVIRSSK